MGKRWKINNKLKHANVTQNCFSKGTTKEKMHCRKPPLTKNSNVDVVTFSYWHKGSTKWSALAKIVNYIVNLATDTEAEIEFIMFWVDQLKVFEVEHFLKELCKSKNLAFIDQFNKWNI